MYFSDLFFVLRWWALLFLVGISFLPLTYKIFNSFLDKGYIFSKILGILFISYAVFILSFIHLLKFSQINSILIWVVLAGVFAFSLRKQKMEIKKNLRLFIIEEFIFFAGIIIWSLVRSFQPDIHDLEKFMDFGFINSILRTDYFPPRDMWLTPFSINYYYFGHLFTGVLTKISAIPSFISFNLMLATIFSFTFIGSFSIGINLVQKIKQYSLKRTFVLGLIFSFFVTLGGNLQTIYAFFKGYDPANSLPFWKLILSPFTFPNAYWYPNATRFIYHTIHEFPSYSFVVADLHGHVLDIPIVLLFIAFGLLMFLETRLKLLNLIIVSFLLAISYMTNAWDGLIYMLLFLLIILLIKLRDYKGKFEINKVWEILISTIRPLIILVLGFFIFTFAFNLNFSPFASGIGLNCSPDFLIKIGKLGPFLFENGQCQHSPWWQLLILYGFPLYMIFSFVVFLRKRKLLLSDQFILTISFFSIFLIIIPEFFYLKDIYATYFRANTMFKLAYQAFIMFAISSVYILIRILSSRKEFKTRVSKITLAFFVAGALFLMFFVVIYPYFAIPSAYGSFSKYKGLNGINYLKTIKPGDYLAINWINKNIGGQPVILEAQGDSYTDYARISANTGLPTVLGWTVHEWLWRGSYSIPAARFNDISGLYETSNISKAKNIINKYKISYVYIGALEKEKYQVSEDKFKKLGKLVYSNDQVKIYKIL